MLAIAEVVGDPALEIRHQEPLGRLPEQPAPAGQLQALGLRPTHWLVGQPVVMDFGTTAPDGPTVSAPVTLLLVIDASSMIGSYAERFTVPNLRAL